ncbi:MAG: hypothetical protein J5800_07305 [Spirochaetales bacterium]|nr:hypothetical protein [Spirochaetales bacterium]
MKKIIAILLVLLALGTVAFAGGFTLRGGIQYDFVNIKAVNSEDGSPLRPDDAIWRANAFGAEFGVTYNFSEKFLIYADTSLGFYNKFKLGDQEIKKGDSDKMSFLSTAEHFGAATVINLSKGLDLEVGGGLAMEYARVTTTDTVGDVTNSGEVGIFALGVGIYGNLDYSLSEKVALSFTLHPDFMFISADHMTETESIVHDKTVASVTESLTTFGAAFSFKFSAALGVTFKF